MVALALAQTLILTAIVALMQGSSSTWSGAPASGSASDSDPRAGAHSDAGSGHWHGAASGSSPPSVVPPGLHPDSDPQSDDPETRALLAAPCRHRTAKPRAVPWRALISNRACIAIFVSLSTHNWSWYLLLSWLPTYLTKEQGIDLADAGVLALLPYMPARASPTLAPLIPLMTL